MVLVHLDHTKHVNAFLLQSLFAALLVTFAFIFNDLLDELVDRRAASGKYLKAVGHACVTFVVSFGLIYALRFIFGWGDTFLG